MMGIEPLLAKIGVNIASSLSSEAIKKVLENTQVKVDESLLSTQLSLVINFKNNPPPQMVKIEPYIVDLLKKSYNMRSEIGTFIIDYDNKSFYAIWDFDQYTEPLDFLEVCNDDWCTYFEENMFLNIFIDKMNFYLYPKNPKSFSDALMLLASGYNFFIELKKNLQEEFNIKKDTIWLRIEVSDSKTASKVEQSFIRKINEAQLLRDRIIHGNTIMRIKDVTDSTLKDFSYLVEPLIPKIKRKVGDVWH